MMSSPPAYTPLHQAHMVEDKACWRLLCIISTKTHRFSNSTSCPAHAFAASPGRGVAKDAQSALSYYATAFDLGHWKASYALGLLYAGDERECNAAFIPSLSCIRASANNSVTRATQKRGYTEHLHHFRLHYRTS